MSKVTKVLSLGGGLDSFAMLLDAIDRNEIPDLVIFADVTDPQRLDPGEWPGTYEHLTKVVIPLCRRYGIEFKWLNTDESPIRGQRSLFRYFEHKQIMPTRMSRLCTSSAKVERIAQYVEDRFDEIEMWIGFEAGEENRAAKDPHSKEKKSACKRTNRFPLIERKLCRCRCEALVKRHGYPVPRKSACVYCPFGSRGDFQTLRDQLPEQFARVEALEANCKRTKKGKRLTFGYLKGDDTDPCLREWVSKPYKPQRPVCKICGERRVSKRTGCDWKTGGRLPTDLPPVKTPAAKPTILERAAGLVEDFLVAKLQRPQQG
jgi:hypothetical protein